jgi:hypothetical protein
MRTSVKTALLTMMNRALLVKKLAVLKWKATGRPAPPPHAVKQQVILAFTKTFKYDVFVETGTYLGAMIWTVLKDFKKIYTVELSTSLHKRAVAMFRKYPHVHCLQGDSGVVLHQLVPSINEGAIFWLDGHYSGGITALGDQVCPIYNELDAIIAHDRYDHLILIDDARLFMNGEQGYPSLEEVRNYVLAKDGSYHIYLLVTDTIVVTKAKLDGRTGIDHYLQAV